MKKRMNQLAAFACKNAGRVRTGSLLLAAGLLPFGASAQETGATTLISDLQQSLNECITSMTTFQKDIFKVALALVVGFAAYRICKAIANRVG